jgi:hypothetical protein
MEHKCLHQSRLQILQGFGQLADRLHWLAFGHCQTSDLNTFLTKDLCQWLFTAEVDDRNFPELTIQAKCEMNQSFFSTTDVKICDDKANRHRSVGPGGTIFRSFSKSGCKTLQIREPIGSLEW